MVSTEAFTGFTPRNLTTYHNEMPQIKFKHRKTHRLRCKSSPHNLLLVQSPHKHLSSLLRQESGFHIKNCLCRQAAGSVLALHDHQEFPSVSGKASPALAQDLGELLGGVLIPLLSSVYCSDHLHPRNDGIFFPFYLFF